MTTVADPPLCEIHTKYVVNQKFKKRRYKRRNPKSFTDTINCIVKILYFNLYTQGFGKAFFLTDCIYVIYLLEPATWSSHYPICGQNSQSPINIITSETRSYSSLGPLQVTGVSGSSSAVLTNNGHTGKCVILNCISYEIFFF